MLRRAPLAVLTVRVSPPTWTMVPRTLGFTAGAMAPTRGVSWADARELNARIAQAAERTHFLTLDCIGLFSASCVVGDKGAPERAPGTQVRQLNACIPFIAAVLPITSLAGTDRGIAFDRFNLHHIFGHFVAQLPFDPQPERSPMRHRQGRVVHLVGEQGLRVEGILQPDALVILGCIEGGAQRVRAIEHQVAGLWFEMRAV